MDSVLEERSGIVHSRFFAGLVARYEQSDVFFFVFTLYLRSWSSGEMHVSVFGEDLCCRLKNNVCNFKIVKLRQLGLSFRQLSKHATP